MDILLFLDLNTQLGCTDQILLLKIKKMHQIVLKYLFVLSYNQVVDITFIFKTITSGATTSSRWLMNRKQVFIKQNYNIFYFSFARATLGRIASLIRHLYLGPQQLWAFLLVFFLAQDHTKCSQVETYTKGNKKAHNTKDLLVAVTIKRLFLVLELWQAIF